MKGFVTIATGWERYYILAYNLLLSYRFHSKSAGPFGIMCDRQNQWTEYFDDVIIIDSPVYCYIDKLHILDMSPYDETIFIDADCLIYRDLNPLWDMFKEGPDVGVLGVTYPLNSDKGWWDVKDLGELKEKVDYKMICQGGMYYVRNNGSSLPSFIETCRFIQEHYFEYHFNMCGDVLEDETVLTLASCVHHFLPVKDWAEVFAYYPFVRLHHHDILSGNVVFDWLVEYPEKIFKDSFLIHFGTANTLNTWAYKKEVFKLNNGRQGLDYYVAFCFFALSHARKRIIQEIKKLLNIK